jgi:hypothetical protein
MSKDYGMSANLKVELVEDIVAFILSMTINPNPKGP